MIAQIWRDFNHTFKMVFGWKNVDLALKLENEVGGDRVTETELVDEWMKHPNSNSNLNEVVLPETTVEQGEGEDGGEGVDGGEGGQRGGVDAGRKQAGPNKRRWRSG